MICNVIDLCFEVKIKINLYKIDLSSTETLLLGEGEQNAQVFKYPVQVCLDLTSESNKGVLDNAIDFCFEVKIG